MLNFTNKAIIPNMLNYSYLEKLDNLRFGKKDEARQNIEAKESLDYPFKYIINYSEYIAMLYRTSRLAITVVSSFLVFRKLLDSKLQ